MTDQRPTCACGQRVHLTCSVCGVAELCADTGLTAFGSTVLTYEDPDGDDLADHEDEVDPMCDDCGLKVTRFVDSLRAGA